jgi:exonuclease SbcD
MRLLHTSDWHLGHSLHGVGRDREHASFLGWLAEQVEREQVDAVLITGDVFDGSNPPADAERQWFSFLAEVRARRPSVEVVVIAGNHDSPSRLAAATPVLASHGVHVVTGAADPEAAVIELGGAVVAAVPFLRPMDLPRTAEILKIPRHGAAPLPDVLAAIAALPLADPDEELERRPYLEVVVALEKPEPRLRAQIEEAMADRRPRLVKITATHTGTGRALGDAAPGIALADLDPAEVFERRWQRDHVGAPPPALRVAFDRLVDEVRAENPS